MVCVGVPSTMQEAWCPGGFFRLKPGLQRIRHFRDTTPGASHRSGYPQLRDLVWFSDFYAIQSCQNGTFARFFADQLSDRTSFFSLATDGSKSVRYYLVE